jgi:hypothetical protein
MRDKSRIEPLLNKIKVFWEENADLRLGQVVYMLAENLGQQDIFFPEEKAWDNAVDILLKQSADNYEKHNCNRDDHDCEICVYTDKCENELPCVICCGAEMKGLKGYTRDCYFKDV